ncbi:hypothetical protein [Rhodoglobus vestalii]|uniref:hypothetical protein n=1 Tax=Rhodoglobus vestalii TaxID=193384 RepID=UPI00115494D5|nr:hypothetical protein [Rhodoglobus vestalii]
MNSQANSPATATNAQVAGRVHPGLRHSGRMLHLGIGRAHNRTEVICLIHNQQATIITHTGTVLAEFTLDPATGYQKKTAEPPKPGVQPFTMS